MKLRYLGYACLNTELPQPSNKTFRLRNLNYDKYKETVKYNLESLKRIILWNQQQKINFFRISSEIIPFASHKEFQFDWKQDFKNELLELKKTAQKTKMRFTMHPGQYTVINSPRPDVVNNAIKEIEYHKDFLEILYPEKGKIVIHTGGVYGHKEKAKFNFIQNFKKLSKVAQQMIILENDDKSYNVLDVLELTKQINIPLVFDILHHICNKPCNEKIQNLEEIVSQVVKTWKNDIPVFHLSSRKSNKGCPHTDYIKPEDFYKFLTLMQKIQPLQNPYDIMIEAKQKQKAVIGVRSSIFNKFEV
ncbi:MAG: UV DNA damage repair endonuclease UvsE [Candidatus Muiribacteriota bacterium]